MVDNLTPAELAEGLEKCEPGMIYELDERIRWFELHGRAALRELAALRAQREWRPIASAPRGIDLLLFDGGDLGPVIGCYDPDYRAWYDGDANELSPTHWMPLPEPPAESRDQ